MQKSDSDCQKSVILEEETGAPVLPCNEGANGEFHIDASLHVSQTCAQKSRVVSLDDWDDVARNVELQSTGTVRIIGSTVNRSAENGSHFCKNKNNILIV